MVFLHIYVTVASPYPWGWGITILNLSKCRYLIFGSNCMVGAGGMSKELGTRIHNGCCNSTETI